MKEKTTSVFYYIEGASNKIDRQKILNSLQKKTKQEIWLNLHKKISYSRNQSKNRKYSV